MKRQSIAPPGFGAGGANTRANMVIAQAIQAADRVARLNERKELAEVFTALGGVPPKNIAAGRASIAAAVVTPRTDSKPSSPDADQADDDGESETKENEAGDPCDARVLLNIFEELNLPIPSRLLAAVERANRAAGLPINAGRRKKPPVPLTFARKATTMMDSPHAHQTRGLGGGGGGGFGGGGFDRDPSGSYTNLARSPTTLSGVGGGRKGRTSPSTTPDRDDRRVQSQTEAFSSGAYASAFGVQVRAPQISPSRTSPSTQSPTRDGKGMIAPVRGGSVLGGSRRGSGFALFALLDDKDPQVADLEAQVGARSDPRSHHQGVGYCAYGTGAVWNEASAAATAAEHSSKANGSTPSTAQRRSPSPGSGASGATDRRRSTSLPLARSRQSSVHSSLGVGGGGGGGGAVRGKSSSLLRRASGADSFRGGMRGQKPRVHFGSGDDGYASDATSGVEDDSPGANKRRSLLRSPMSASPSSPSFSPKDEASLAATATPNGPITLGLSNRAVVSGSGGEGAEASLSLPALRSTPGESQRVRPAHDSVSSPLDEPSSSAPEAAALSGHPNGNDNNDNEPSAESAAAGGEGHSGAAGRSATRSLSPEPTTADSALLSNVSPTSGVSMASFAPFSSFSSGHFEQAINTDLPTPLNPTKHPQQLPNDQDQSADQPQEQQHQNMTDHAQIPLPPALQHVVPGGGQAGLSSNDESATGKNNNDVSGGDDDPTRSKSPDTSTMGDLRRKRGSGESGASGGTATSAECSMNVSTTSAGALRSAMKGAGGQRLSQSSTASHGKRSVAFGGIGDDVTSEVPSQSPSDRRDLRFGGAAFDSSFGRGQAMPFGPEVDADDEPPKKAKKRKPKVVMTFSPFRQEPGKSPPGPIPSGDRKGAGKSSKGTTDRFGRRAKNDNDNSDGESDSDSHTSTSSSEAEPELPPVLFNWEEFCDMLESASRAARVRQSIFGGDMASPTRGRSAVFNASTGASALGQSMSRMPHFGQRDDLGASMTSTGATGGVRGNQVVFNTEASAAAFQRKLSGGDDVGGVVGGGGGFAARRLGMGRGAQSPMSTGLDDDAATLGGASDFSGAFIPAAFGQLGRMLTRRDSNVSVGSESFDEEAFNQAFALGLVNQGYSDTLPMDEVMEELNEVLDEPLPKPTPLLGLVLGEIQRKNDRARKKEQDRFPNIDMSGSVFRRVVTNEELYGGQYRVTTEEEYAPLHRPSAKKQQRSMDNVGMVRKYDKDGRVLTPEPQYKRAAGASRPTSPTSPAKGGSPGSSAFGKSTPESHAQSGASKSFEEASTKGSQRRPQSTATDRTVRSLSPEFTPSPAPASPHERTAPQASPIDTPMKKKKSGSDVLSSRNATSLGTVGASEPSSRVPTAAASPAGKGQQRGPQSPPPKSPSPQPGASSSPQGGGGHKSKEYRASTATKALKAAAAAKELRRTKMTSALLPNQTELEDPRPKADRDPSSGSAPPTREQAIPPFNPLGRKRQQDRAGDSTTKAADPKKEKGPAGVVGGDGGGSSQQHDVSMASGSDTPRSASKIDVLMDDDEYDVVPPASLLPLHPTATDRERHDEARSKSDDHGGTTGAERPHTSGGGVSGAAESTSSSHHLPVPQRRRSTAPSSSIAESLRPQSTQTHNRLAPIRVGSAKRMSTTSSSLAAQSSVATHSTQGHTALSSSAAVKLPPSDSLSVPGSNQESGGGGGGGKTSARGANRSLTSVDDHDGGIATARTGVSSIQPMYVQDKRARERLERQQEIEKATVQRTMEDDFLATFKFTAASPFAPLVRDQAAVEQFKQQQHLVRQRQEEEEIERQRRCEEAMRSRGVHAPCNSASMLGGIVGGADGGSRSPTAASTRGLDDRGSPIALAASSASIPAMSSSAIGGAGTGAAGAGAGGGGGSRPTSVAISSQQSASSNRPGSGARTTGLRTMTASGKVVHLPTMTKKQSSKSVRGGSAGGRRSPIHRAGSAMPPKSASATPASPTSRPATTTTPPPAGLSGGGKGNTSGVGLESLRSQSPLSPPEVQSFATPPSGILPSSPDALRFTQSRLDPTQDQDRLPADGSSSPNRTANTNAALSQSYGGATKTSASLKSFDGRGPHVGAAASVSPTAYDYSPFSQRMRASEKAKLKTGEGVHSPARLERESIERTARVRRARTPAARVVAAKGLSRDGLTPSQRAFQRVPPDVIAQRVFNLAVAQAVISPAPKTSVLKDLAKQRHDAP